MNINTKNFVLFFILLTLFSSISAQPNFEEIDRLIQNLQSDDFLLKRKALKQLYEFGPKAEKAIPALIENLKYHEGIGLEASWVLSEIGTKSIPALLLAAQHENFVVREHAIFALGDINEKSEEVISILIQALQDPIPDVRYMSIQALGRVGKESQEIISLLISRLDKYAEEQILCETLIKVGGNAVQKLIQELENAHVRVRRNVSEILRDIEPKATQAIPYLLHALKKEKLFVVDWEETFQIDLSRGILPQKIKTEIEHISKVQKVFVTLPLGDYKIKTESMNSWLLYSPKHYHIYKNIDLSGKTMLYVDAFENMGARGSIINAIIDIGFKEDKSIILQFFTYENQNVREYVVDLTKSLTKDPKEFRIIQKIISHLETLLSDKNWVIRWYAINAFNEMIEKKCSIGQEQLIPILEKASYDANEDIRKQASEILMKIQKK